MALICASNVDEMPFLELVTSYSRGDTLELITCSSSKRTVSFVKTGPSYKTNCMYLATSYMVKLVF